MARSRSPDRENARVYWLRSGGKATNTEIAEHLGVSVKSVARWRKEDAWIFPETGQNSGQKKNKTGQNGQNKKPVKIKALGNKNAVGHGAPEGNINALKNGKYSKRYWDFINDDEAEMLSEIEDEYWLDEERQLTDQLKLYTIRERRLMEMIMKVRDKGKTPEKEAPDTIIVGSMVITEAGLKDGDLREKDSPRVTKQVTNTEHKARLLLSLEEQLGRTQERKAKTITMLRDVRTKRAKAESERHSGDEDNRIMVYLPDNSR